MSFTYSIADVHGRCDLLDSALERIVAHAAGRAATVGALGDYVDRGPASRQVVERFLDFRSETLTLVALKGNHEVMM
jgi:serine/threonine protein phosphatase 1